MTHLTYEGDVVTDDNKEDFLSIINPDGVLLVSISRKGAVTIHRDGGAKEAAEVFYKYMAEQCRRLYETPQEVQNDDGQEAERCQPERLATEKIGGMTEPQAWENSASGMKK